MDRRLTIHKILEPVTQHLIDFTDIEMAILAVYNNDPCIGSGIYIIITHTVTVRLATGWGGSHSHDINDFSIMSIEPLKLIMDRHHASS